jgi:hypothetical protein
LTLTLPVFTLKKVTLALLATLQLTGSGEAESLSDGFSSLLFSITGHKGANSTRIFPNRNGKIAPLRNHLPVYYENRTKTNIIS